MDDQENRDKHRLEHYEFNVIMFTLSSALVLAIATVACVRYLIELWGK